LRRCEFSHTSFSECCSGGEVFLPKLNLTLIFRHTKIKVMLEKFIKREILADIQKELNTPEILVILGSRQVGKTTLLKILEKQLKDAGEKTLFFNLDIEEDREHFKTQREFIKKIELEIGKNKGFVFIDEIQRKENASLFLKGLYDMGLPYKFIVTGSGSPELKSKIKESLVGRKIVFELLPVSFKEFLNFKTDYKYQDKLEEFIKVEERLAQDLFFEYLNFGGYPRVILGENLEEKLKVIREIYNSYLEKDITYFVKREKLPVYSSLVKILADQVGRIVNYGELSNTLGASFQTIKTYLYLAEKTFVLERITPFYRNIRKELIKSPVVYFYDLGLVNFALGRFGNISPTMNLGFLIQNLIFLKLKERSQSENYQIHFWRTKTKNELDFVLERGREILPIEVKYSNLKIAKVPQNLKSFLNSYPCQKALIINRNLDQKIKFKKTEINFINILGFLLKEQIF